MKPFSEACEENKRPILEIIRQHFADASSILEIGTGTGQHAVFFAEQLPHLLWTCSDLAMHHAGIKQWLDDYHGDNIDGPLELDVETSSWPSSNFDGIFSANTTHIMSWAAVEKMFNGIGKILQPSGRLCLYGPFNYAGEYTSASNEQFDQFLRARDPQSGIRDFEALDKLARDCGLRFIDDHEMPVNNRTLVWAKG